MAITTPNKVRLFLERHHYLGPSKRGIVWFDPMGVIVFAKPTSRRLPQDGTWLEVTRWCIHPPSPNAGSQQWAKAWRRIMRDHPEVTTFVSYSDPSQGHTGALYRACNWIWAPTWHRLRPPPSGNGDWGSGVQSVKDRWVFPVQRDECRLELLAVRDAAMKKRFPDAEYREPKRFR